MPNPSTPRDPLCPTPTLTMFFREENMAVFAQEIAPGLAQTCGSEILRIAQVGCSTGEETWSLASALSAAGVEYRIHAIDANPTVLKKVRQPYKKILYSAKPIEPLSVSDNSLEWIVDAHGYDPKCLKYFKKPWFKRGHIEPVAELTRRVRVEQRDILAWPLDMAQYGAVIMNNILYHLPPDDRNQLIDNALCGLVNQGVFMIDTLSEHKAWAQRLPQERPLVPMPEAGPYWPTVFRYDPQPNSADAS